MLKLIALGALLPLCSAVEEIRALQPRELVQAFSPDGIIPDRPALFGIPNYASTITGQIVYATPEDLDGCTPIQKQHANPTWPAGRAVIVMVDRGNCTFVQKVRNGETAGASAVIVVDNVDETILPFMADDGSGRNIGIPSILIHKDDGQKIKNVLTMDKGPLIISMSWRLPRPDNHVEWELWTSSLDPAAAPFKQSFRGAVESLGNHASFQPFFWIQDMPECAVPPFPCPDDCVNEGRYCTHVAGGITGRMVMEENLRQACLFNVLNRTGDSIYWWDYASLFIDRCTDVASWNVECSFAIMRELEVDPAQVTQCMTASGGTERGINTIFEDMVLKKYQKGVFFPPTVYINNQPYRGSLYCPAPIELLHCGVLEAICQGFIPGSGPDACSSSPGCPIGVYRDECGVCGGDGKVDVCQNCLSVNNSAFNQSCLDCTGVPFGKQEWDVCGVCGGDGTFDSCGNCLPRGSPQRIDSSSGCGFPVYGIVGLVLGAVVVVAVGVYCYMKRQQDHLRNDIDTLLKQYLPLDAANTLAHPAGAQQGRARLVNAGAPASDDL